MEPSAKTRPVRPRILGRLRIPGKLVVLLLVLALVPMAVVGYQTFSEASADLEEDAGAR